MKREKIQELVEESISYIKSALRETIREVGLGKSKGKEVYLYLGPESYKVGDRVRTIDVDSNEKRSGELILIDGVYAEYVNAKNILNDYDEYKFKDLLMALDLEEQYDEFKRSQKKYCEYSEFVETLSKEDQKNVYDYVLEYYADEKLLDYDLSDYLRSLE